jgi:hypothetical protein
VHRYDNVEPIRFCKGDLAMSHRALTLAGGAALALLTCASWSQTPAAPTSAAPAATPNDYSKAETWLCRPGRKDACAVDLTTTVVAADGKLTREAFKANPNAPIDCFYVYPTVSLDQTGNSDMTAGQEELNVVRQQFARFAAECRVYAPLYRQITLTALRAMMSGKPLTADRNLTYQDVLDSWNYYLKHDNKGRGVVLIGHSQGSGVLTQLIKNEVDGKPVQAQLVSAILMGTNLAVPAGKDVGGAFTSVPLCHSAKDLGCAIAYASFRATSPPPANTRFGKVPGEGMASACSNPASLGGGSGNLHAYLSAASRAIATDVAPTAWVSTGEKIETPFVSVPGLLSSQCVSNEHGSYLEVTVNADPKDPRTDTIQGDVVNNGQIAMDWGLHLIDANLAMGDLVKIVGEEAKAYAGKNKSGTRLSSD